MCLHTDRYLECVENQNWAHDREWRSLVNKKRLLHWLYSSFLRKVWVDVYCRYPCLSVRSSISLSVRVNIYHGNSIYIIWSRHNIIWSDWACITFLNFQFAIWGQSRVEKMTFSEAVVSFEPFSKIQANSIQEYDFACFVNAELGFGSTTVFNKWRMLSG